MKAVSAAVLALLLAVLPAVLVPGRAAQAAEIRIITSRAMATALEGGLGAEFEESTGHRLRIITGHSPKSVQRIHSGEAFDLVIAPTPVIDDLAASGRVVAETRTSLVRYKVGVAKRAGAPKPDLHSVQASWIVFAAAVFKNAPEAGAARELLKFLADSKAHPVLAMQGLEPA